jgi:TetR/AcrR family transcriptional regulator, cholesterol catabolism regulator
MKRALARSTGRRVEILRAAAFVFRRRGFSGASVEEIARHLRMTKGNLYYYFRDKEEILYFCHDYSLDILLDLLHEVEKERLPADARLRRLVVAFVHMIIDELAGTALTQDLQDLSPSHLRRVIRKRDRFDRGIRRVLEKGMADGTFVRGDAKLLSFAILGAVNYITRWFDPRGEATSQEIGEAFADYLLAGLGVRGRKRTTRL